MADSPAPVEPAPIGNRSLVTRRPKTVLTVVVILGLALVWVAAEFLLAGLSPYAIASTGYVDSYNGRRFGWGFDAGEVVRTEDPDTGTIFMQRVNNHGWRDRDRATGNLTEAYRIIVIGDSSSFGFVVPLEAVFTRVLETRLRADGFNVQVLNMSGPGFGTDQELEILKREAMDYGPDLVIFHITGNDLANNLEHRDKGKPGARKPFFYELNDNGGVTRNDNPRFSPNPRGWRRWKNNLIRKSEILKRGWAVVRAARGLTATPYHVSDSRLRQAAHLLGQGRENQGRGERFLDFLRANMDSYVTREDVLAALDRAGIADFADKAFIILADRYFQEHWSKKTYDGWDRDPGSEQWRLFFALLTQARDTAKEGGARFALVSDHDPALFEWNASWFNFANTQKRKNRFLAFTRLVQAFAADNGIGFIENTRLLTRARNDPHNNAEGFENLAANIYDYLMENHRAELDAHRLEKPEGREGTAR